ncbi:hypothetical protein NESM_000213400 [Novymonas esmeraldas]|uniref:Uncharacterized protein n=1 Tax=Novymonas esmeraldas TaxID=1808958 RepID=A0AAW0F735_9TRYP
MAYTLSVGSIVGMALCLLAVLLLFCLAVFVKHVCDRRRLIRRAVREASRATQRNITPAATQTATAAGRRRSRYPEALPCDDYDVLFGVEEPARGNVVFRSRADMAPMRDLLVRVEDAGDGRSSADFTTTEMVSLEASFAHSQHTGRAPASKEGVQPRAVTAMAYGMGSFDNEHNVAMSLVSVLPTPASSMPNLLGMRQRSSDGRGLSSSYGGHGLGSQPFSFGAAPALARVEGQQSTALTSAMAGAPRERDTARGGVRLLVPLQERRAETCAAASGHGDAPLDSDGKTPSASFGGGDSAATVLGGGHRCLDMETQTDGSSTAPSPTPPLPPSTQAPRPSWQAVIQSGLGPSVETTPTPLAGLHDRADGVHRLHHIDAARLPLRPGGPDVSHTAPQPLLLPLAGEAGPVTHQYSNPLSVVALPPVKRRKVRVHRQHRVRNIDKGGYVILEESESSEEEPQQAAQDTVVVHDDDGAAGPEGERSGGQPQPAGDPALPHLHEPGDPSTAGAVDSPAAAPLQVEPVTERKRRYFFEKVSSLDVYGRGAYVTLSSDVAPLAEHRRGQTSDDGEHSSNGWRDVTAAGGALLAGTRAYSRPSPFGWPESQQPV